VIFGFGTAFYGTTRITILTDLYPENSGTAIGLTLAAGDLGNTVLPIIAGLIAATFTWQLGFGFTIPIFILAAVSLWVLVPRRTSAAEDTSDMSTAESGKQLLDAVFTRTILLGTTIQLLGMFVWQGFTGFYPTYLVEVKNIDPSIASLIFGGFFALGMGVRLAAGAIGDRYGTKHPLLVVMAILAASLFALPFMDGLVMLVIVTIPLTALLGMGPIIFPYLVESLPEEIQGSGFGLMRTFYMVGAATGPFMIGALADLELFDEAFIILAGIILVAWILVWLIDTDR
jgi:MFS family permease